MLKTFEVCCDVGFTSSQANCIVDTLLQITSSQMDHIQKSMVAKPQQVQLFSYGTYSE